MQSPNNDELEHEHARLLKKRDELGIAHIDHQNKLSEIRDEIRRKGKMPQVDYNRLLRKQQWHRDAMMAVQKEVTAIRARLVEIHLKRQEIRQQMPESFIGALVELRNEYQMFAADLTRVASMRQMASQFVMKLDRIILTVKSPEEA